MRYIATFVPQAWVNDYAVDVDPEGPTDWDCTNSLAGFDDEYRNLMLAEIRVSGEVLDFEDRLQGDLGAPEWVRQWHGPFGIWIKEG